MKHNIEQGGEKRTKKETHNLFYKKAKLRNYHQTQKPGFAPWGFATHRMHHQQFYLIIGY